MTRDVTLISIKEEILSENKELAEELRERIPELDAVEWFLDT